MLLGYGSITQNLIESLKRETSNQRVNKFIVMEYILLIKYSINFNDKFEPKFGILNLSRFGYDIHNKSINTKELNKDKNAWH